MSSERKHWLKFLNRDTAFFLGAEEIARTVRYAAFFAQLRRVARGHYEVRIRAARGGRRAAASRRIHRPLRAHGRGTDPRGARRLAVVAQALEAQKAAVRRLIRGGLDLTRGFGRPVARTLRRRIATTMPVFRGP